MKKILFLCFFAIICLILSMPVSAQIYKYETNDGQVIYTNDYAQIPAEYRNQLSNYDEKATKTSPKIDDNEQTTSFMSKEERDLKRQELTATRDELTQTFQRLTEKQQALEARRESIPLDDDNAWDEFNAELTDLNLEIETYKQRSATLVKEADEFNKLITEVNKNNAGQ